MPITNTPKPVIPGREITPQNFKQVLADAAYDAKVTKEEAEVILQAVEGNLDQFEAHQVQDARSLFTLATEVNPDMAALAVNSGKIQQFHSTLRLHIRSLTEPQIEVVDRHPTAAVHRGLPLSTSEPLHVTGPSGTAFLVGAGRDIENLEVRLRPIHHSLHGDGYEARFKVTRNRGNEIESLLAQIPDAKIVEKKIQNLGVRDDGAIHVHTGDDPLTKEEKDAQKLFDLNQQKTSLDTQKAALTTEKETAPPEKQAELDTKIKELQNQLDPIVQEINTLSGANSYSSYNYSYGSSNDAMTLGHCVRVDVPGQYRIDYFPEEIAKQAMRGSVHIEAFGANEEEKKANLKKAMAALHLDEAVQTAPTDESMEILKLMRLLWQASPPLASQLQKQEPLTIDTIKTALQEAKVPEDFVATARYSDVVPGHISVVIPGQAEAYQKAGVRGLIHTIQNTDKIVDIIADGLLSSTQERLTTRKVITGMSSSADLKSGGAEYVFTRLVTEKMGNPTVNGAVISFNLNLLDRADWFAYPADKYGSTYVSDEASQGVVSDALKTIASRTHPNTDNFLNPMRSDQATGSGANSFWTRPTGRALIKEIDQNTYGGTSSISNTRNEAMFQSHIPVSMMNCIIVTDENQKKTVIDKLAERGITEVNGMPASDFIRVQTKLFAESETPVDDHPTYI